MAWTAQRQAVLAQNIANADTPGWKARDVAPFAASLSQAQLAPEMTAPNHLPGSIAPHHASIAVAGERAPDGNTVSIDRELVKIADTDVANSTAADLYKSYLGMFKTALGR